MPPPPAELFASRIFLGPALRAQPDGRLVGLVREGYDSAFEEIVRRYRRPLERFAAAIVGGRCEDVTQDAFSKALLALRGSEAQIELRPWLYRIVRNTALNDLRDRGPVAEQLSEALAGGASAAAEVERREELADLMQRLGQLPEPQRAAIVMRELEGLSHEEIASALGVSGGAARQAIYRARAALRDGLGLLVPMPVLRGLIDHGEAARDGAIAAGAGAAGAGGAIGGLGAGGTLKVGAATLLVAGTVGAGVAIEQHRGGERPEAAVAAPLADQGTAGAKVSGHGDGSASADSASAGGKGTDGREDHGDGGGDSGPGGSDSGGSVSSGQGTRTGSSGPSSHSDGGSGGHDGGSGGGGGSEGGDDHGGLQNATSDDGGGSSGGSGSDDGGSSGSSGEGSGGGDDGGTSGSSGEGSGGTVTIAEPVEETGGESGSDSGSGSSGDGSGDLTSGDSSGSDGSP